ncbi:hypothetical protein RN001_005571 [Aquatica leii]|uniref:DUF4806 domain-containing protein n=1 Tax=Aquatica leii TaxID=1421715 RepID=A0AAN7PC30_9COLE|nr:hypothetical protein RN001_005571 [Aquatica leii]
MNNQPLLMNSQSKEFAVVYFCSDKTTSEIPVSWLTENESACWWPPSRYASSYIVNKYNPDPQTWTKHAVKVEFYCASLKLARKKADDLNCTTEDDDLQRGRGQRKLKRIIKDKGDKSDSESDNSHDSPPHIENHRQVSSLRHDFNVLDIPIVIAEEDGAYSQAMEHEIPVVSNMYAVSDASEGSSRKSQGYPTNQELKDSMDRLIKQSAELQQDLKQILLYQKSIDKRLSKIEQNKQQISVNNDNSALTSLLPINSINRLQEFEDLLTSNEEIRDAFKRYISNIGGKSPRDNVYRIFSKIYSNNLANLCSWLGQRNNFRVCDLHSMKMIKDAVMLLFSIKENEFEAIAKEWFRLAKNRIIQANKKNKKNQD